MQETTQRAREASGVPVHCSFTELADVTSLIANPRNPNRHPDKQIAMLAKIIRHQGWRAPITVSNRSGFVVTGHGRLEAAKLLQVEKVPVDRQDFATEADEWAHLVADNRIAELAEIDETELSELLKELDGKIELELAGFDEDGMRSLEESIEAAENEDGDAPVESAYTQKIKAPVYEPKGEKPPVCDLFDEAKTNLLKEEIRAANLPEEVEKFMLAASDRHTVFNFRQIAEFYCHADKSLQALMEKNGLVIIDFKAAIENGFVHLTEELGKLAEQEEQDGNA